MANTFKHGPAFAERTFFEIWDEGPEFCTYVLYHLSPRKAGVAHKAPNTAFRNIPRRTESVYQRTHPTFAMISRWKGEAISSPKPFLT